MLLSDIFVFAHRSQSNPSSVASPAPLEIPDVDLGIQFMHTGQTDFWGPFLLVQYQVFYNFVGFLTDRLGG